MLCSSSSSSGFLNRMKLRKHKKVVENLTYTQKMDQKDSMFRRRLVSASRFYMQHHLLFWDEWWEIYLVVVLLFTKGNSESVCIQLRNKLCILFAPSDPVSIVKKAALFMSWCSYIICQKSRIIVSFCIVIVSEKKI